MSTPTPASPPLLEPLPSFDPIRASGLMAGLSMPPRSPTVATAAITVTASTMSKTKHYTPRDSLATSPRFDFSAPAPGFTPLPLLDDDSEGSPPTEGLTHFFPAPPVDIPSGPAASRAPVVSPSASALPRVAPPTRQRSREPPRTELREQPQSRAPPAATRNVTSPAATHPRRPPPPPQSQSQPSAPMQIQYSPQALIRSPSSPNANPKPSPTSSSELAYLASGRPYPAPPKWHTGPPNPPRPALSPPFVPPARPPPRPRNFGPPPGIASTLARSPPRSTSLPGLAAIEQGRQYFHPGHRPQGSLGGTVPTPYGHQRQNSGSQGHQRQLSGQQGQMVHAHQRQLSGSAPAPYYPQQHPGLTYQQNMAASAPPDQRSRSRQASNGGGGAGGLQRGPSITGPGLQRGPSLTYGPPVNVYADTTAQISSILTGPVGSSAARRPPPPSPSAAPAPALLPPSPLPSQDDGERSSGETAPTSYIATPPNASPDPTADKYTSPRPAPPSPKAGVRVPPPLAPASYPTQTRLPPPKLSPRSPPPQQELPLRKSSLRRPAKPRSSPPPSAPPVPKAAAVAPAPTPAAPTPKSPSPPKRDFFRKNSASSPQQQQHAHYIPHSQRARHDAPAYPGVAGMEARLALVGMSTEPEAKPARRWGNKI